jgi:hypothetical protein
MIDLDGDKHSSLSRQRVNDKVKQFMIAAIVVSAGAKKVSHSDIPQRVCQKISNHKKCFFSLQPLIIFLSLLGFLANSHSIN